MRKSFVVLVLAIASGLIVRPAVSEACGGCFGPSGTFAAVDKHRIVVSLGTEQSVLWDQFIYSGDPEDFAWVLPVPSPNTTVEIADSAFIDTIDRETTPLVRGPACFAAGAGCGFGPGPDFDETGSIVVPGVDVKERQVVGPYDVATITAENSNAMDDWLWINGYAFPLGARPVLDHYIAQGSAFIALRLAPGEGVDAMAPVRVTMAGALRSFPLRMMTIGASGTVEMSLWILAEQRYEPVNYVVGTVDEEDLVWDFATETSNYADAFTSTIEALGGRAWITEHAAPLTKDELAAELLDRAEDDYKIAIGHNTHAYLTRLRSIMLLENMNEDLELAPATDPSDRDRTLVAARSLSGECGSSAAAPLPPPSPSTPLPWPVPVVLAAMIAAIATRVRARCAG